MTPLSNADEFSGTERYAVVRRLGAGGMGVVYEALDRQRNTRVALKTLRRVDGANIYRLKHEFRALAGVSHPGLAMLHELVCHDDTWFFTMELVQGVDFLAHVRPGAARISSADTEPPLPLGEGRGEGRQLAEGRGEGRQLDLARLRSALGQLCEAVAALHVAGKLHRDLKPSNVLVTPQGRVVVLDFGLVTETEGEGQTSTGQAIVGTAAYMAPEQANVGEATSAADWYAVGVMLYEALTGRVPFAGSPLQVLLDKQRVDSPPPISLNPEAPADLNALCVELLRRAPERRPSAADILRRVGVTPIVEERAERRSPAPFVGREKHLRVLRETYEAARAGKASVALLYGESGMGKTALARRFLEELRGSDAVVLSGRCYERESMPYKALDSLIDGLTRYLTRAGREKAEALLPRDVQALARIFPVLRRIGAVADAPLRAKEWADPQELRRRAFAALRELAGRMADRAPLVLFIDDAQWGDVDSAALLAELLHPPDAPPLMLLLCYRGGRDAAQTLTELLPDPGTGIELRELMVEALEADEARELAEGLLGGEVRAQERLPALVRESGGSPFFIDALVRSIHAGEWESGAEVSLDAVVRARALRLPSPAQRLLEVVAVAGRPIPSTVAARAAELATGDVAAFASLRAAQWVRTATTGAVETVETYHDRIRESVVQRLSAPEQADCHLRIARALEASGWADSEALAFHFEAAGLSERAAQHAASAAARATEALAFDRAAKLYRQALELWPDANTGRQPLRVALGDALAHAGRGFEAAQAYEQAVKNSPGVLRAAEVLELRRRATEQLLRSGHVDEGLIALRAVLSEVGMTLAPTPRRALGALLWRRAHLALRGIGFRERDESQVSAEELTRIDVCWSVAAGLSMVDTIRAASFQTRHLLLALSAGEPLRVARALAAEAAFVATGGSKASARAARLIAAAEKLAAKVGDARLLGLVSFCAGLTEFLVGRWREAQAHAERAERIFHDVGSGLTWEAVNARLFSVWSLFYLGEIGALRRKLPAMVAEAQERGDLYSATSLRSGLANVALLAADDVEGARREVREVMGRWSKQGFHFQHYWGLLSQGMIGLYANEAAGALAHMEAEWGALERALLLRIQNVRIEAWHLRARLALAAGKVDEALRIAHRIHRERIDYAAPIALCLQAGAAGDHERFRQAERLFEAQQMPLFAAAAKRQAGELLGGDEGRALIEAADGWMRGQDIARPERMAAMLAPTWKKPVKSA
ncbi:MAG: serine/threonine-protein kinase PknK [Myxococcota bacterium]